MADRILIVEDDITIAGNLYAYLEAQGFEPDVAYDGVGALSLLRDTPFDAMVLDIGLPGTDGLHVLHALRNEMGSWMPVLILTARDALEDKLAGFAQGADDYLTKPFALAEVHARLNALIQRARGQQCAPARTCGPLRLDVRNHQASVNGVPVHLTRKAAQILALLMREPGRVMTRAELEQALWRDEPPSSDALRSQVHLLRRALSEAGFDGIQTTHGVGWRLVCPDRRDTPPAS